MKCYIFTENEMQSLLQAIELAKLKKDQFDQYQIEKFKKDGDFQSVYESIHKKFVYIVHTWKDGKL